jgi:hypothetical protein
LFDYREILGPKREEERGAWRKLHTEELVDLYSSLNIIGMFKSRIDGQGPWHQCGRR